MTSPPGLRVEVLDDAEACAARVAGLLDAGLRSGSIRRLGVATGSTPERAYQMLGRLRPPVDGVRFVLLDEYVGLDRDDPASYRSTVVRQVVGPLGGDAAQVVGPDVWGPDGPWPVGSAELDAAAVRFDAAAVGVDLQVLGLGGNGHIAFNEPGSSFTGRSRVVALSGHTRAANARFFGRPDLVPTHAVTQGLATVGSARRIVLLVTGPAKAAALGRALEGPVSEDVPATAVRGHRDVLVVVDREAAGSLRTV